MQINLISLSCKQSLSECGFKGYNLSKSHRSDVKVPQGFICGKSFCNKLLEINENMMEIIFNEEFLKWINNIQGLVAIRSSAIISSSKANLVSGLFTTVRRIAPNKEDIIKAMLKVLNQSRIKNNNLPLKTNYMKFRKISIALIIQKEVDCVISGVIHSKSVDDPNCIDIWFKSGDLAPLMSGYEQGHHVRIPKHSTSLDEIWCSIETLDFGHMIGFWSIIRDLIEVMSKLETLFNNDSLLIEWGRDTKEINILQVQDFI